ncbi:MAG: lipid A export permease/ATP-binding protein MsbA [Desulfarculales bacterium]|nr:lipid A export permease/ATP-binding protein MsbA [Desulfarculales bacterium]
MPKKILLRHDDMILARRMLALVRPHWRRLALAMFLMLMVSASTAALAYMVQPALDDIFIKRDSSMVVMIPLIILILYGIKGACSFGQSYFMNYVGESVINQYRIMMYEHLQKLPLSFYDKNSTGELMSRITNDVNSVQQTVSSVITSTIRDFFMIVGLVGVIVYRDWFMSVFALLVFPLCVIPLIKFGQRMRGVSTRSQESRARLNDILHETFSGVRIVKGFCREKEESLRFSKEANLLFDLRLRDLTIRAMSSPAMEALGGIGIAAIVYYAGERVISGLSTPGLFFSFLAALLMLYEPLKRLSNINNDIQGGLAAGHRIYDILDTPQEITGAPALLNHPPTLRKQIEFRDLRFSYDSGREVIKDISLTVPAGNILALVGPSGGGKTTLINLLPRFYELNDGAIFLDGDDIRDFSLRDLRSQIAIVTQQTFLFNDTVRANISYARPEASPEEIMEVAAAAYAMDFIERLPKGLDSVIGEAGVLLSGGERQRLSIARALLANRPILILDEATSSLDTHSEMFVQKALENLMQNRTTLVIAHRLSTVRKADRIVVINEGRIVETGGHEQLLAQEGLYKSLHDMQFKLDEGMGSFLSAAEKVKP